MIYKFILLYKVNMDNRFENGSKLIIIFIID